VPLLLIVLLILSCASIPQPHTPDDTLVIGSLVLDFPDGFFDYPPRTITSGIELVITNKTEGYAFSVRTFKDGYFCFVSNGHDSFSLDRFSYERKEQSWQQVTLKSALGIPVTLSPGRVRYLGKLTIAYRRPQRKNIATGDRTNIWQFEPSVSGENQKQQMIEYLRTLDPNSQWLSYEIVQ